VGLGKIDKSRRAEIIRVDAPVAPENIRTRVRGRIRADPKTVDVSEAQIVVAGGRGAVTADSFDMVWKLADLLGGSVGGTRPAVDSGCIPLERQIGQSGKTISPRLYIACGISGQVHHTVGIKDSKTIIAIDKDRNAPIFKMADLGVVADLSEMFPAIIHAVEDFRRKSQKPVIGGTAL
jgi:electron transfer flavoprotein alpha subunit